MNSNASLGGEGKQGVLRWETFERGEHILLMIIMFMFIISGLPFLSSAWFGWMTAPPVTLSTYMGIHLAAAALYFALGLTHVLYHVFGKRHTEILISKRDLSDAWKTIKYYVGGSKEMPKFGFHEPTEKLLVYWGVAVILMIGQGITGLILYYSYDFSVVVRQVALDLHVVFFFLIIYVIMMHIYMTALYKENRPMLDAMFSDGTVPDEFAQRRFPRWVHKDQPNDDEKGGD